MKTIIALSSLFIFGCSTAKVRVLPGEKTNRVVVRDIHRDGAEEAATKAAGEYCSKKGQELQYIGEKTNYTGEMDESTRNMVRKGSQAAMLLGGAGSTMHGHHQGPSALLGTAGTVGYVMTSDRDYETSLEFKCPPLTM